MDGSVVSQSVNVEASRGIQPCLGAPPADVLVLYLRLLPVAFRAYRQDLGMEGIWLHGAVALLALVEPERFTLERLAGDVEMQGELTRGATVFDRRPQRQWRPNVDVAVEIDAAGALDAIARQWRSTAGSGSRAHAPRLSRPAW